MKFCAKCQNDKPLAQFANDKSKKDGVSYSCRECVGIYKKSWDEKHKKTSRRRFVGEKAPELREAARLRHIEQMSRLREANPEQFRQRCREYKIRNSGKINHLVAKRQEKIRRATPPWASISAIESVYLKAAEMSLATGVKHHVDHVIPVLGKRVCGLHVEHNLRVIPASENIAKSNSFDLDSQP